MSATTTHDDLVEIGKRALWDIRLMPLAGVSDDELRQRNAEAVLAAVTPEIERRAKVAVLEELKSDTEPEDRIAWWCEEDKDYVVDELVTGWIDGHIYRITTPPPAATEAER